jgi:hypothetical protein
MLDRKMLSTLVFTAVVLMIGGNSCILAQNSSPTAGNHATGKAAGKQMIKDEVYTSIARRLIAVVESPATAIVAEVDTVVEVTNVAMESDGKATATVIEKAESNGSTPSKSIRLKFAPPASGEEWTWVEFEDKGRFYAVDKLLPVVKSELGSRKKETDAKWVAFIASIGKQGDAANKVLETAKSIIKSEPPQLEALKNARKTLVQAITDNEKEVIVSSCLELSQQSESITSLGDSFAELKANDAYLRLLEEHKKTIEASNKARKDYVQSVEAYNDSLVRLPYALVAYGLRFTKIEPNITAE